MDSSRRSLTGAGCAVLAVDMCPPWRYGITVGDPDCNRLARQRGHRAFPHPGAAAGRDRWGTGPPRRPEATGRAGHAAGAPRNGGVRRSAGRGRLGRQPAPRCDQRAARLRLAAAHRARGRRRPAAPPELRLPAHRVRRRAGRRRVRARSHRRPGGRRGRGPQPGPQPAGSRAGPVAGRRAHRVRRPRLRRRRGGPPRRAAPGRRGGAGGRPAAAGSPPGGGVRPWSSWPVASRPASRP